MILEIDDSYVVTRLSRLTKEQHEFEQDYLANGKIVLMQAPERYISHLCDSNSHVKTVNGICKVFAMRDIQKGRKSWGTTRLMDMTMELSSVAVETRTAESFIEATTSDFPRYFRKNIFHISTIGFWISSKMNQSACCVQNEV